MGMWKKVCGVMAAAVLSTGVANAAVTPIQSFSFGPGNPALNQNGTFTKFDTSLGTLTNATFKITLNVSGGQLRIDNDGASGASDASVNFGATANLTSGDVTLPANQVSALTAGNVSVGADDGDIEVGGTANFSQTGSDYAVLSGSNQSSFTQFNAANLAQLLGPGTFDVALAAQETSNLSTIGGAQRQIDPLTVGGTVELFYTYTAAIPTPAALPAGLALLGAVAMRRRRR